MTSFTRKLYEVYPHAAEEIRRQSYRDYRYGKHVTLAQFALDPASRSSAGASSLPAFGKREIAPVLAAYECWGMSNMIGHPPKYPKQIVRAADSFAARSEYARHHHLSVLDVCALKR